MNLGRVSLLALPSTQYSHADRDGRPVTLRIDTGSSTDYFINFNRKIGMNSQNREGSDLVNVYEQSGNGETTGGVSKILKKMNEGVSGQRQTLEILVRRCPSRSIRFSSATKTS